MSNSTIAEGLKLNYAVIVDNVNATRESAASLEKGNSLANNTNQILRELITVNKNMIRAMRAIAKSMLVNHSGYVAMIEAFKETISLTTSQGQFRRGNIDDIISSLGTQIEDIVFEGRGNEVTDMLVNGASPQQIVDELVLGLEKLIEKNENPNQMGDDIAAEMKAMATKISTAITTPLKKLLAPIMGMGKAMIKMAVITQPIMSFFEGMLQPFKIFGKIMKAFGAALGANLIPSVIQMVSSMVKLFPLLEIIMPLIFEGIAAIAIWIGYGTAWIAGLDGANSSTATLTGSIPILSGSFQSLNVYADGTTDSMSELGLATGELDKDISLFSLNPITLELDSLKTHIEGYKIDTSNMDTFFTSLQGQADSLNYQPEGRAEGQGGVVNGQTSYGLPDISAAGGAAGGAIAGAMIGSMGGPLGMLAGAGVGALAGAIWGWTDDWDGWGNNTGI